MDKGPQSRATASEWLVSELVANCKLKSCGRVFRSKRKDQVFCSPKCKSKYTQEVYRKGLQAVNSRGMHARTMSSPQLKKLHFVLSDGALWTTAALHRATGIEAVGTAVSELRRCGYTIKCKFVKITETGAKVFEYKLEELKG